MNGRAWQPAHQVSQGHVQGAGGPWGLVRARRGGEKAMKASPRILAVAGARICLPVWPQVTVPMPGPNVSMVSGAGWPGGDPFVRRQNEPFMAVSSRNSSHLLGGRQRLSYGRFSHRHQLRQWRRAGRGRRLAGSLQILRRRLDLEGSSNPELRQLALADWNSTIAERPLPVVRHPWSASAGADVLESDWGLVFVVEEASDAGASQCIW
jgi:hypothetical protein